MRGDREGPALTVADHEHVAKIEGGLHQACDAGVG